MNNNTEDLYNDEDIHHLISRFEKILDENALSFFDVAEFESIIDFYFINSSNKKILKTIQFAERIHPDSIAIQIRKAQYFLEEGEIDLAKNILENLLLVESTNIDILYGLGIVYCHYNDFPTACSFFDKALTLSLDDKLNILYSIALKLEQFEKFDLALEYLYIAYQIDNNCANVLFDIALCYDRVDQNLKSIKFYNKYLDIYPYSEVAWFNLGVVYCKIDNLNKALECFNFAIAADYKYALPYLNKAITLSNLGNYSEAIKSFYDYIEFDDKNALAYYYLGECYENIQIFDKAIFNYRKVIELNNNFDKAFFGLSACLVSQDNFTEALVNIQKAIEIDNKNSNYWFLMANVYAKLEKIDDAIKSYDMVVELAPFQDIYWLNYADYIYNTRQSEEAIKILKKATDYNPKSAALNYRLAIWLLKYNNDSAFEYLTAALSLDYNLHRKFQELYPLAKHNKKIKNLIEKYKK